jgi:Fe-S-cluster containining protein
MESPFLLRTEANAIASRTDRPINDFVETSGTYSGRDSLSLKAVDGKCVFYDDGKCTVYEDRPIDCRLFPFDVIEDKSGSLLWIVYEELCPTRFDYRKYFESAKRLIAESGYTVNDIRNFASHGIEVMSRHKYKVIEAVELPQGSNE